MFAVGGLAPVVKVDSLLRSRHVRHLLRRPVVIQPSPLGRKGAELNGRAPSPPPVLNSTQFLQTSITLFLNKVGVFKAKVLKVPFDGYFPEYIGGLDINKAAKDILWRFMQANWARFSVYPQ